MVGIETLRAAAMAAVFCAIVFGNGFLEIVDDWTAIGVGAVVSFIVGTRVDRHRADAERKHLQGQK